MRKILIHTGIILLLLILCNQFAILSGKVYKDGASIVCEQKRIAVREEKWEIPENKKTVLFFGASDILSSIVPHIFDSTLNYQTYSLNLALPALPIGPYYHTLLDYIENNDPPDYIVMSHHVAHDPILLFDSYANQGINFPNEFFSYLVNHNGSKHQTVNYLLPCHVYNKTMFKYLYNSLANPIDIENRKKINTRITNQMIEDRGYYFIQEQSRFPKGRLPDNYKEETDCPDCEKPIYDPDEDIFVEKFLNLTREKNIQVLLINYPVREGKYKQFEEVPDAIKKIIKQYDNVSYPREGWKIPFYSNKYFSDPHHVNKEGADLFTQKIARQFKNIYKYDEPFLTNRDTLNSSDSLIHY